LPEVARCRVRAARLPVVVAAAPLSGGVPLRAPERAADGLLPTGEPRARRAAARGGGAVARRESQRRSLLTGALCYRNTRPALGGAGRALLRRFGRQGARGSTRYGAREPRSVPRRRRPCTAHVVIPRRARSTRPGRCVRLLR